MAALDESVLDWVSAALVELEELDLASTLMLFTAELALVSVLPVWVDFAP